MSAFHQLVRPPTCWPYHSCRSWLLPEILTPNLSTKHVLAASAHRRPSPSAGVIVALPTVRHTNCRCHSHFRSVTNDTPLLRRPDYESIYPKRKVRRTLVKTACSALSPHESASSTSDRQQGGDKHSVFEVDSNTNHVNYTKSSIPADGAAAIITSPGSGNCAAVSNATATGAAGSSTVPGGGGDATSSRMESIAAPAGISITEGVVAWFRRLVTEQYLPLMLLTALIAAALKPSWGLAASRTSLQAAVTFTIFVLQGVMLRRGEAEKALDAKGAITWGLASILLITPLVAPLAGSLPLHPPGLALGLLVFACMPTTLSSGVALTQVLGGNTALALLLTISTNMASVFTLPFLLPWALQASAALGGFSCGGGSGGSAVAVQLDPVPLLVQLVQCILMPTLIGAGLRGILPDLRVWVDANRRTLSVVSGALLSLVPWMQVSKALAQGVVVAPAALAAAVGCSLAVHVLYLGLNAGAAQVFRLGGTDPRVAAPTRRALIIVASQKTLPVAMAVLGRLGPVVGPEAAGCAAVTAVFSHLAQTCVDFWLVSRWLEFIRRCEGTRATASGTPSPHIAATGAVAGLGGTTSGNGGGGAAQPIQNPQTNAG